MKTQWIQSRVLKEQERLVNEFEEEHNVKATQTHVTAKRGKDGYDELVYTAVCYYLEEPKKTPQVKVIGVLGTMFETTQEQSIANAKAEANKIFNQGKPRVDANVKHKVLEDI